jgi:predicted regulator of Ras-like GTPase activity (Roadblock/LC7/MglB family)
VSGRIVSRFGTEFGAVMEELLQRVPGAYGAVFSDRDGYAIDFAHDPNAIEEIDMQLTGAQCGLALLATAASAKKRRLGRCDIMFESTGGSVLGTVVDDVDGLVLVMLLRARAHLGLALRNFEAARDQLAALLP